MGHALLASSGNPAFAAKLTILTDRPGDPPVGLDWGPVVSGFPLGGHYVFLRTQPDPTVGRAGMVRSYAAYVPLAEIGGLNNLPLVFNHLPVGLAKAEASISPMQLPDDELAAKPDPQQAPARSALARLLCAPNTKLPLVWAAAEPYLSAVATLWAQLPASLRASFAFLFQFAPEYRTPVEPTIVATLPDLAARWPASQLIQTDQLAPVKLTLAQSWFAGSTDGGPFEQLLRDYAIDVPRFSKLNLISTFADLVTRLPELSFAEARRAVNIAAKHSRSTPTSAPKRTELFARLCELARQATAQEILTLRNLANDASPELIPPLQEAMRIWVDQVTKLSAQHIELLEIAVENPTNWWSKPFIHWLQARTSKLDQTGAALLIEMAGSAALAKRIAEMLPGTPETEKALLGALPKKLPLPLADNLLVIAAKRRWMPLHATCLLRSVTPTEAIARHADVAGASEGGFNMLKKALGFDVLALMACESGTATLVRFVGGVIGRNPGAHLSHLRPDCSQRNRILQAALLATPDPLEGGLGRAVVEALNSATSADASLWELCTACIARDVALLFDLDDPAALLARLPEAQRGEMKAAVVSQVQREVQLGHTFRFANPQAFRDLVDPDDILAWLASVPVISAARAGVNAFRSCSFLDDGHCRRWLVELFTQTQYQGLQESAAAAISGFLAEVSFPESARVVRETAEHFNRQDVAPIHDQIRYKYQMARAYTRNPEDEHRKLPKVLIATALPLERNEVIMHLPSASYDHNLFADVALWPAVKPVCEVYVTTTGAGNLSAQSAVLRTIRGGLEPRLAFFVGVCGGVKDSEIADVVYSTKVYYFEGGKEHDGGISSRPALKETSEALVQLAHRVAATRWQPQDSQIVPRPPKSTPAVFASGELVLASTEATAGNYQRLKSSFNDTQVVDMEAYGFLKAMQDEDIKLSMVIRGVSDKIAGKAESDARGNQPVAARNAAAFLFALLKECQPLLSPKKKKERNGLFNFLLNQKEEED